MYECVLELGCDICVCTGAVVMYACILERCCDMCVCWSCGVFLCVYVCV